MFNSTLLYLLQTVLIAGTLLFFLRREARVLQLQVLVWAIGVIGIMLRSGTEGQLGFYSNDQLQYAAVVRILTTWQWGEGEGATFFWWTDYSKLPYPAAAVPLALTGIHIALALKTVSLISLLLLSRDVLVRYANSSLISQAKSVYLTGCGFIGSFFSLLALRETMMMYFVYRYVLARSSMGKLVFITMIFLLRSHLAAAIIAAELVLSGWIWISKRMKLGFLNVAALLVGGLMIGYSLFNVRFNRMQGYGLARLFQTPFSGNFGITETTQFASNFAGLQFLTAHEAFVRLSISELVMLRTLFSDTVLIPIGFTVAVFLFGNCLSRRHQFALLTFTIYVAIVINTDFNSFRQNIPLMPLMGMVILDFLQDRKLSQTAVKEHSVGRTESNGATSSAVRTTTS